MELTKWSPSRLDRVKFVKSDPSVFSFSAQFPFLSKVCQEKIMFLWRLKVSVEEIEMQF